jgi:hypothetical protein
MYENQDYMSAQSTRPATDQRLDAGVSVRRSDSELLWARRAGWVIRVNKL